MPKITTHITTNRTLTLDDGTELELGDCPAPLDWLDVQVAPREGGGWNVAYVVDDAIQDGGFWEDRHSGVFREFTDQRSRDQFFNEMVAEHGKEQVFIVDKYEHSAVHYSPRDTAAYPDRQWDVAPCAVFVVPEDATNKLEYATAVLQEYSDWCNGAVYGVTLLQFDADGTRLTEDADEFTCWGLIGTEYAEKTAESSAKLGTLNY